MKPYTSEQLNKTIKIIDSTIQNCQNIQPKFKIGTSQYTLLQNRIKALLIAKSLILNNKHNFTKNEVQDAIAPIESIIHKSTKALSHTKENTGTYTRLQKIRDAMTIALAYLKK